MSLRISGLITILILSTLVACNDKEDNVAVNPASDNSVADTKKNNVATGAPDPTMFEDGALTEDVTTVECTLSDGTEASCYRITIAGKPSTMDEGPYCPPNITSDASSAGSWFGKNGEMIAVDGPWIKNLSVYYNDSSWDMYDPDTGEIYVETGIRGCEITGNPNPPDDLENPSFCLECFISDMPDGAVEQTMLIPVTPVKAASSSPVKSSIGFALNGVLLEKAAPLDLILSTHSLGMLDDCGAHANPRTGYHYHAVTDCVEIGLQDDGHSAMIGIALDGFSIFANTDASGSGPGELDECDGQTDDVRGYHYHAKPGGFNQIISCFSGVTGQFEGGGNAAGGGRAGGDRSEGRRRAGDRGAPDFTPTAEALSASTGREISAEDISSQLGNDGPPDCDDITNAATANGVTAEELISAGFPVPPQLSCDFK